MGHSLAPAGGPILTCERLLRGRSSRLGIAVHGLPVSDMNWIFTRLTRLCPLRGAVHAATAELRRSVRTLSTRPDFRLFAAVWLLIGLYRTIFIVTYPMNSMDDSTHYLGMIVRHESNLIHAGGYPFFMNAFLFWNRLPYPPSATFLYIVQILQHGIEWLSLAALFFCLSDIFNKWLAALALVFVGMDIDAIAFTNMSTPEWLQADLFVLSLCASYRGHVSQDDHKKYIYYGLSFALFVLCWLVKFNALVFVMFFIPLYFAEKSSRKRLIALASLLAGAAVYALFMISYHYPTTKSRELTADVGWLLMAKVHISLGDDYLENMGPRTKLLIALNSALPKTDIFDAEYNHVFMLQSVDAIPPEIRKPYRDKYLWLLNADDTELEPFIQKHPIPKGFWLASAFIPISYYLGLQESDSLCTRVFLELVSRHLWKYIRYNQDSIWEFFSGYPQGFRRDEGIRLPIAGQRTAGGDHKDSRIVLKEEQDLGFGFVRYVPDPVGAWTYPYNSFRKVLWTWGEPLFSLGSRLIMPNGILLFVLGVLTLRLYRVVTTEGFNTRVAVILFILLAIPGFVTYSDYTYFFRDKELRFLWPVVGTAYAIALWTVWDAGAYLYRRAHTRLA